MMTVLIVAREDQPLRREVMERLVGEGPDRILISAQPYSNVPVLKARNIVRGRNELRSAIEDDGYVYWADTDVLPPVGVLSTLQSCFEAEGEFSLGAIGCYYNDRDRTGRHVSMGATMVPAWIARRIKFRALWPFGGGRCECYNHAEDIRRMGFRVEYHPTLIATHLR